ncbi:eCIS core domain-containing protein [Micromonosporaceae bacterium Da 78-11]
MALTALAGGGSRALSRLAVQPKLTVSRPGDPFERQADAVAEQVTAGEPTGAAPSIARLALPSPAAGEPPESPPGLQALLAAPGAGAAIPAEVRGRIEQHLGFPLGGVQVHGDARAQTAAAQLGARAFTTGNHIYLGAGESAGDLTLMAHEATHVVQQQSIGVYRLPVQRDATDLLTGGLTSLIRGIPGYDMLTVVAGYDPIANRTVDRSPENLVRGVLGLVPFGNLVAGKLIELGVVQDAYRMIDDGLTARNLTLQRIQAEIDRAWKEIDLTDPDGAVAIVRRHVSGLYTDALTFVRGIYDAVVQLIRDAAVALAEKHLVGTPVWELTKKVLRHDPLRGTPVEASTVEILTDFLKVLGKEDTLKQMQERGTLQKTADWLDTRIAQFLGLISELKALFQAGWQAIQPENIASLPDNLTKLAGQAIGLIGRVGAFAKEVITEVLKIIKEALLDWLSREATTMRGFRLLTVVIGEDPFTGKAVARSAENLIGGFIALLPGGEATYKKLSEAGVIADAAAQIEGAMARLGITPELIVTTFRSIWNTLTLEDLLNPLGAFLRVLEKFGEPLGRIVEFAGEVLKVVVTLILKLMNFPSDLLGSIIANAMAAIEDIKKDPVAFLLNMLQALKSGFLGFIDRVLTYLMSGLADWLFRGLGALGIKQPADLTFGSILTLVLQVLDITTEKLWKKLGKHIGDETVEKIRKGLSLASDAFDFVKDVQENGVGAIWKHVESQLGNLWDTLLGLVKDWIVKEIVEKATMKLISMLDPTGIMAVVNSSIALFKAIQSVIEYVRELLTIVNDYVTTLAAVAAGNIQSGAQKVEKGLAAAVPVAIGFLANQIGLGNVPEKLVEIIEQARILVDTALDWLFAKAVSLGKAALEALGFGGKDDKPVDPQHDEKVEAGLTALDEAEAPYLVEGKLSREGADKAAAAVKAQHPIFSVLKVVDGQEHWNYEWAASPGGKRISKRDKPQLTATFDGTTLTIGTATFKVGDEVQVEDSHPSITRTITSIGTENGALMVRFSALQVTKGSGATGLTPASYPAKWHAPIAGKVAIGDKELEEANKLHSWADAATAKKVLNFRVHQVPLKNPAGKDWEHIAEDSTGGGHSDTNLALADGSVNKRLNHYYTRVRVQELLAYLAVVEPISLRSWMEGKDEKEQQSWKKKVYALPEFGVALKPGGSDRGAYLTLE